MVSDDPEFSMAVLPASKRGVVGITQLGDLDGPALPGGRAMFECLESFIFSPSSSGVLPQPAKAAAVEQVVGRGGGGEGLFGQGLPGIRQRSDVFASRAMRFPGAHRPADQTDNRRKPETIIHKLSHCSALPITPTTKGNHPVQKTKILLQMIFQGESRLPRTQFLQRIP